MARPKLKLDPEVLNLETAEAQYWRGYLAANCNVIWRPGHEPKIIIETPAEDSSYVLALKDFLKSEHRLVYYRNSVRLSFTSQKLAVILYERGLWRKPYSTRKPLPTNSLYFWRGVLDAKATIGKYNGYMRVGTRLDCDLSDALQNYTCMVVRLGSSSRARGKKTLVSWNGTAACLLLEHFYLKDASLRSPKTAQVEQYLLRTSQSVR